MNDLTELTERYAAVWGEPDPELRRKRIAELWTTDAVHLVQPPAEMAEAAAALGMTTSLEARGHEELELRVRRAYQEFVEPGQFVFRARPNAARLRDVVTFTWEMVTTSGDEVAAVGVEFLHLAADGRIRADYQFIEA